jgi:enterochelin esterase family protein
MYTHVMATPTILDNLLAERRIPPLVAVLLESADRGRELACSPAWLACLTQEVVPWVRQTFGTTVDPRQTIVGGASLGGLAAAYAGLHHPELFGNIR